MNKLLRILFFSLTLFVTNTLLAQVSITGKVSSPDKKGVEGVSVTEKGTKNGAVTDKDGKFIIKVKSNTATLLVSAVNYREQQIALSGRSSVDVTLQEETSTLNEVSVTAGRQPVRKLETTQAVDIINNKVLKSIKPESFAEAVTLTPGVFANNSQGRRGGVVIRGFPDGNPLGGLVYTSILIDGLPAFGSAGRLPDAGFGFDDNIEKVEVVRGSTATVYGRSAAAGVINMISKTGGEETHGSVKFSRYDNIHTDNNYLNYRLDWNVNGSVTADKLVRYNIGGWFIDDRGFRKTGYNDQGYQLRGNFDFINKDGKGKIRLGLLFAKYSFQNLTDVPLDPTNMKLPYGWRNTSTFIFPAFTNITYSVFGTGQSAVLPRPSGLPVPDANGVQVSRNINQQLTSGNFSRNIQLNFQVERDLGSGWTFENKFRYQSLGSGTKYPFSIPSFYNSNGAYSPAVLPTTLTPGTAYTSAGGAFRLMLDGDAYDNDVMNEARIKKNWTSGNVKQTFQAGYYFSSTNLRPTTYSYSHFVNPINASDIQLISGIIPGRLALSPVTSIPLNITIASATANPQRGSITRRGIYTEQVNAIFGGYEAKFNDKLTINVGARYDALWMNLSETKAPFDSAIKRILNFGDYSASVGFNYLFNRSTSIYANVNRAYRMPDYSAFTSLEYVSATASNATASTLSRLPNGLSGNEIIISSEVGFRKQAGDVGFDVAVYYNTIKNRLASIFENGLLVSKPFGSNRIMGAELSISYNPSQVLKGLSVRSSITIQKATFTDFKISNAVSGGIIGRQSNLPDVDINGNLFGLSVINEGNNQTSINVVGNKLPGVPDYIWNTTLLYTHKWFGLDFSSNVNGGKRYADATNLINLGELAVINTGGYFRWAMKGRNELRIGLQCKNLGNRQGVQNIAGLAENSTAMGQLQATPNFSNGGVPIWAQGYLQLPRRWIAYISFDF
ncbi:MAG: TonB-dependent receptor [Chitinophagaceae bacterium]|nr:TonB-dependent receptor [Chitinophagaceae bacterium]